MKSASFAALFYLYKRGYKELFIDGGLFSLIDGQFERKIVFQILDKLRTNSGCTIYNLQGKYGSSFTRPSSTNIVESEQVFLSFLTDQFGKFAHLMKGKNKYPVFLNEDVNFDFQSLKSTSVVGNSSSLLKEKNKDKIESNQCVVRINDSSCVGYEDFVGSRTDFRFINNLLLSGSKIKRDFQLSELNELCGSKLIFDTQDDTKIIEIAKALGSQNELYFISKEFSKEIEKLADIYNLNNLSSGLKVTLLFSALSDRVEVFGTDFYASSQPHYWENTKKDDIDQTHNWNNEKNVFNYLEDNFQVKRI